jgi:hypothetical protein
MCSGLLTIHPAIITTIGEVGVADCVHYIIRVSRCGA